MKKQELFEKYTLMNKDVVCNVPKKFYPQERDWTCSIACIRTLLTKIDENIKPEDYFIETYNLQPGPLFSKDIKRLNILKDYNVLFGCDFENPTFDDLIAFLKDGYYIMIESMLNFSHWLVLIGYFPSSDFEIEKGRILVYDPFYDCVRLLILDECISMWIDGNFHMNNIEKDFIAIKK